jgi:hypothetical protein
MKYLILSIVLALFTIEGLASSSRSFLSAYQAKESDVQIRSTGVVVKILGDDNSGSRHQKCLLKLATGHTVLISHNVDLAPKVKIIDIGDSVEFCGEYEWNCKGGVVHWTQHDPAGKHQGGWLKHTGTRYE